MSHLVSVRRSQAFCFRVDVDSVGALSKDGYSAEKNRQCKVHDLVTHSKHGLVSHLGSVGRVGKHQSVGVRQSAVWLAIVKFSVFEQSKCPIPRLRGLGIV